jgi:hypothetical protein
VRAIYEHSRKGLCDRAIVNRERCRRICCSAIAQGAEPVQQSLGELRRMGLRYVTGVLLHHKKVVRHDQARLTRLLLEEFVKRQMRKRSSSYRKKQPDPRALLCLQTRSRLGNSWGSAPDNSVTHSSDEPGGTSQTLLIVSQLPTIRRGRASSPVLW